MIDALKNDLWKQFGASIDMLHAAIALCPEQYLTGNKRFFYMSYHTIVFFDYYLSLPPDGFKPVLSFTIAENGELPAEAIDDVIPDEFYSKAQLLYYLCLTRNKCKSIIESLSTETLQNRFVETSGGKITMDYSILEILFYNMRHLQHYAAQLNLMLRKDIGAAPGWISRVLPPYEIDC